MMEIRNITLLLIAILSAIIAVRAGWCPDKYKRYSLEHSYCLRTCCACPFYKKDVSEWMKNYILFQHNSLRSKVAGGNSYGVDHLPRATNMLEMVWDDELATIAQKWAYSCHRNSDCDLCRMVERFAVGQYIIEFEGETMSAEDYNSEFFINFQRMKSLQKSTVANYSDSAGKGTITQLLWAKTWRIGCGFLYFRDPNGRKYAVLICNYGPRGNIEGEEVYKGGDICFDCPANTCCGDQCKMYNIQSKYHGLCKVIDENLPPEGKVPHEKNRKEIFYCGFNGESDCSYTVDGVDRWIHNISTGGTWISTYLGSGGYTILKFEEPIVSKSGKMCLRIVTRSGPTVADQPYKYELVGEMGKEGSYGVSFGFPKPEEKVKHFFHTDYFQPSRFPKNQDVRLTLKFSVPYDTPRQYIEIKRIVAEEKDCPKETVTEGLSFIVE